MSRGVKNRFTKQDGTGQDRTFDNDFKTIEAIYLRNKNCRKPTALFQIKINNNNDNINNNNNNKKVCIREKKTNRNKKL